MEKEYQIVTKNMRDKDFQKLKKGRGSAERCSRERGWRRAGGRSNRRARALSQTFPCAPRF